MKLTLNGIKEHEAWEKQEFSFQVMMWRNICQSERSSGMVHLESAIFSVLFIGGIADGLLEDEILDRGITCVETFDYDVVDKIYEPYDNLGLNVILHGDGTREYKVLGALAEAVKAQSSELASVEPSERNFYQ